MAAVGGLPHQKVPDSRIDSARQQELRKADPLSCHEMRELQASVVFRMKAKTVAGFQSYESGVEPPPSKDAYHNESY